MVDPISLAVATAVAGKSAEKITEQGITPIISKIREKLSRRSSADVAVLDATVAGKAEAEPLAQILDQEFASDPEFHNEIKTLWHQAAPVATDGGTANVFNGNAKNVIQTNKVEGGIHLS